MQSSAESNIFWYTSAEDMALTATLVDRKLCTAGWQPLPSGQSALLSYILEANAQRMGATALVSITEQSMGCSVLIQIF